MGLTSWLKLTGESAGVRQGTTMSAPHRNSQSHAGRSRLNGPSGFVPIWAARIMFERGKFNSGGVDYN
ncbi:MAG: hypothetical protein QF927_07230, partial [Verrucomicrobiota bacterium]|nr:hypothetical protein [Verrucomicrobiota bacterium]